MKDTELEQRKARAGNETLVIAPTEGGFRVYNPANITHLSIRPVLEQYLRFKFPRQFGDTEWLGDFIPKIRNAGTDSPLYAARSILTEVEDINDYSKRYHHNSNPGADTESIADGELRAFVRRTLSIVGGF